MNQIDDTKRWSAPSRVLRGLRVLALASACALAACGGGGDGKPIFVTAWETAPSGPQDMAVVPTLAPTITFSNQTLRMIVRSNVGGNKVRVRLSNETGQSPQAIRVGQARVALRTSGGAINSAADRQLTFSGSKTVTIAPGSFVLSDPVDLDVPALADLSVSVYLPEKTLVQTMHHVTRQAQYLAGSPGDHTADADVPTRAPTNYWFMLTGLEVSSGAASRRTLVAFGDSITDGFGDSTARIDAPTPWPSWPSRLAERVQASTDMKDLAVVNAGIAGNRVLNDAVYFPAAPAAAATTAYFVYGKAGVSRFDRDVVRQAGSSCSIVLEGINDIGQAAAANQPVTAQQIIDGYRQMIAKAKAAGLKVIGATLLPYKGYAEPYYTDANNEMRKAVNAWIRGSGEYDAVIDFDAVMRDPADPDRLRPDLDSGDHLHPNDIGYKVMADSVDLGMLKQMCLF